MTDEAIIALYWNRDEGAITQTAERYGRLCRSIAHNILGNAADVEECENDVYAAAWNRIPPERPQNFAAFLGCMVRNIALDRYAYNHAQKRNSQFNLLLDELEECLAAKDGVEEQIEAGETAALISRFLQGLDTTVRKVFVRRYWYADSIETIARGFGMSQSKVKSMLLRTRNKLKAYLEQEGVTL